MNEAASPFLHSFLVASEALVKAVKIEKNVSFPMIALDDEIELPIEYWLSRFSFQGSGLTGILSMPTFYYEGRNIINPFTIFWHKSAGPRIASMMSEGHKEKYEWLLRLHESVGNNDLLLPPKIIERFLEDGILVKNEAPR